MKQPHSLLIVVDRPASDASNQAERFYQEFRHVAPSILQKAAGCEMLSENVYLLSLEHGMSSANQIFSLAEQNRLGYRMLFLDEKQAWLRTSPLK
jgi:hypothetical protein